MPIVEFSVAMMTSQQPSSTALPAKQRPDAMPTSGTKPDSRGRRWKVSLNDTRLSVSLPRPPPPSQKMHDRKAPLLRHFKYAVLLMVAHVPLRPGHHGIIIRHDDRSAFVFRETVAVDLCQAHDQAIRRGFVDQLLHRHGAAAR